MSGDSRESEGQEVMSSGRVRSDEAAARVDVAEHGEEVNGSSVLPEADRGVREEVELVEPNSARSFEDGPSEIIEAQRLNDELLVEEYLDD